jgi:hypothetical protein
MATASCHRARKEEVKLARKATAAPEITAVPRFAAEAATLAVLEEGLRDLEAEINWLKVEDHLARQPSDRRVLAVRETLRARRKVREQKATPASESDLQAVTAALEALREGARPTQRLSRQVILKQLIWKVDIVKPGCDAQQDVVSSLRGELSAEQAVRDRAEAAELALARLRAEQAASAAADAEEDFRRSRIAAGYTPRPDLQPTVSWRCSLVRGSERDSGSEISNNRRRLEELKVL